jgi:glycosyltransferase involved in cell wall biosynthesis
MSSLPSASTPAERERPLVTLILPAFNEAAIIEQNLAEIDAYLRTLDHKYRWEVIVVNDGSVDDTGKLAEAFAASHPGYRVIHHWTNFGLGQAFRYGFAESRGDYVITMDLDLSYSVEHIGALLEAIETTRARLVLASPYMKGGRLVNVPWTRKTLSIWANRFLRAFSAGSFSTFTCMTRAYDGEFIRALNIRATDMAVMPEVVYKSMILRARIVEIPATLDWTKQQKVAGRKSSMRLLKHILGTVLSSFILRPFAYLVIPGVVLLLFSMYVNAWMLLHFFGAMAGGAGPSDAVAIAYREHPHTFIVGLLSLMLSVQLVGLGALALQSKRYFEELFHFQTAVRRQVGAVERAVRNIGGK